MGILSQILIRYDFAVAHNCPVGVKINLMWDLFAHVSNKSNGNKTMDLETTALFQPLWDAFVNDLAFSYNCVSNMSGLRPTVRTVLSKRSEESLTGQLNTRHNALIPVKGRAGRKEILSLVSVKNEDMCVECCLLFVCILLFVSVLFCI